MLPIRCKIVENMELIKRKLSLHPSANTWLYPRGLLQSGALVAHPKKFINIESAIQQVNIDEPEEFR